MREAPEDLFYKIEPLLPYVEKPARYLDHEWGVCEDQTGPFHVCMIYPDVYEVGQPNLAISILYNTINAQEGMSCERGYVPWLDMAELMRKNDIPLLSLERSVPVASFDVVGITLPHELAGTNIIEALDLAHITLLAAERQEDEPFIFGGGPSVWNSEPVAPLFDAILLGDGEEAIVEMCACVREGRARGASRYEICFDLAAIPGVYVPSLYEVVVDETSTRWGYAKPKRNTPAPARVFKRTLQNFSDTDAVVQRIVPYMGLVQDRLAVEVLRGCARGCRFCQAGMTYRPVRERPVDDIVAACHEGLTAGGFDECSLSSLSTTDHSQCREMLVRLDQELAGKGIKVSIPSQRMDAFGVDMAAAVGSSKKGGLTFAPEAGSQRLRDVINKNVTEADIELAARNAFSLGWRRMKLYFMMGLPTETDEDIQMISRTATRVLEIGREVLGKRSGVSVSISVAVFVPKAYTPFQWCGQLSRQEVVRRQQLLLHSTPERAVRISYHDASTSEVEAALSKMGRAGFNLIMAAWKRGCRFDAWTDCFSYDAWAAAAQDIGFDLADIATESFDLLKRLPWDHTTPGVSQNFLKREWQRALEGVTTADCTRTSCVGCGVCPTLSVDNVLVEKRA